MTKHEACDKCIDPQLISPPQNLCCQMYKSKVLFSNRKLNNMANVCNHLPLVTLCENNRLEKCHTCVRNILIVNCPYCMGSTFLS